MDANRERAVGRRDDPSYIWLRYSTQFTTGGRTHTIEMEVPVPVGASAEERERLIREAEANMEQLYRRVEGRARGQRPPETAQRGTSAEARPAQSPDTQRGQPYVAPATPGAPGTQGASPAQSGQVPRREARSEPMAPMPTAASATPVPTPREPTREAPQPLSLQDRRAGLPSTNAPAATTRPGVGAELPVSPDLASSASGNMKLGEFIQIIRESWGITPKQALDLLQVKSLNNMNYRDLLRRLEPLVGQANGGSAGGPSSASAPAPSQSLRAPATPTPPAPRRETGPKNAQATPSPTSASGRQPAPTPAPAARAASTVTSPSSSSPMAGPTNIPVYPIRDHAVRESGRAYRFDEEEEEDDRESASDAGKAAHAGTPAGQTGDDADGMSSALARIKIDDLKAIHGNTAASPGRINVLHNVLGDQISDEQFQELLERIWHTSSDKKLKQDQVEALISWAKEDYFEDEVRAVLAVLNEE
jgi:hypothetical protein